MIQESDKIEIEKTTYLASLVSDPLMVDPSLDKLRFITSQGASVELTPEDRKTVREIQDELEEYLIHKEKVGSFTREGLHRKLTQHFSREYQLTNKRLRRQLVASLILPFVIAAIVFLALSSGGQELQLIAAIPALLASQYVGLLWFFWSSRSSLVATLRKSLLFTMSALVVLVLGGISFVTLAFLPDLANQPILSYGGPLPIYIVGFYLFYIGAHIYAKQIGVNSNWTHPKVITPIALAVYFGIWLLPHGAQVSNEVFYDISVASFGAGAFLCAVASALVFSVVQRITQHYAGGLIYLAAALAVMAVSSASIALTVFMTGTMQIGTPAIFPLYIVGGAGFSIAFILLYISAYTLKLRLIE